MRQDWLKAIKALIDTPEKWCQNRTRTFDLDGRVVRRCLVGAAVDAYLPNDPYWWMLDRLREYSYYDYMSLARFNDASTHEEVMAFLDHCISISEREE